LSISPNLRVLDEHEEPYEKDSYVVYSIRNTVAEEPEWEIYPKTVTLLEELRGKREWKRYSSETSETILNHTRNTLGTWP